MVVNSMAEISSFVEKFVNLWKRGGDVSLNLETHAGQACVSLRLGLRKFATDTDDLNDMVHRKKVSPSRLRRRERRASARRLSAKFGHAGKSETEASEQDAKIVKPSVSFLDVKSDIEANEIESKVLKEETHSFSDSLTEKVECSADSEHDLYIFSYWDNLKVSDVYEASSVIESRLKGCFERNIVNEEDRVIRICDVQQHEENEVRLLVKLKKNILKIEHSARNCQSFDPQAPAQISLKAIER